MAKNSRQKVPKSDFQGQFSMSKIIRILPKFFSLKNIKLGAQLKHANDTFCLLSFLKHFKIGSKFQTLIPTQALICPKTVRKCLSPFN